MRRRLLFLSFLTLLVVFGFLVHAGWLYARHGRSSRGAVVMLIRKESKMMPTESRERPMLNGGHAGPFPLHEAEAVHGPLSLGDGIESAIPDWDKLWVDLGGEG